MQAGRDVTVNYSQHVHSTAPRGWWTRTIAVLAVAAVVAVVVVVVGLTDWRALFGSTSIGSPSPTSGSPSPGSAFPPRPTTTARTSEPVPDTSLGESEPIMTKTGYRLTPSSDPRTNDQDKIDLDTGCPGWGTTSVPIGRKRCGELADLIVETYGLHAPNDAPLLSLVSGPATLTSCRDRVDGVGTIQLEDLADGAELCVRTDKHNIAAVHVKSVDDTGEMVIDYEIWEP
ncbi:hypothetical protein ACFXGA_09725 [Actinosynnema sp. NPDC059335]|uniref:hypothetical protein n=1 Tax=Actinosynnema sp. NPDC059335 TaxID=3346804 RepID=UPI00366F98CD